MLYGKQIKFQLLLLSTLLVNGALAQVESLPGLKNIRVVMEEPLIRIEADETRKFSSKIGFELRNMNLGFVSEMEPTAPCFTFSDKNTAAPLWLLAVPAGGISVSLNSIEIGLRYKLRAEGELLKARHLLSDLPMINELTMAYDFSLFRFGLAVERFPNTDWEIGDHNAKRRMSTGNIPFEEYRFSPGTAFSLKISAGYMF